MKRACVLVALIACKSNDAAVDAPMLHDTADQHVDAALDASPEIAPLIGTWKIATDPPIDPPFRILTFQIDGKLLEDTGGGAKAAKFSVPAPNRLRITETDDSDPVELDILVSGTTLGYGVYLPQGAVTGFVGTWKTSAITPNGPFDQTVIIADDHTGSLQINTGTPITGTWATEGTGIVLNTALPVHLRALGAVLTSQNYLKE